MSQLIVIGFCGGVEVLRVHCNCAYPNNGFHYFTLHSLILSSVMLAILCRIYYSQTTEKMQYPVTIAQ